VKKKIFFTLISLFFVILISGCINISPIMGDNLMASGNGRLKIFLTDAPGDYLEVNITISKIEAHMTGEEKGAKGNWVTLKEWMGNEEPTFNLIELHDVNELLVDENYETGKYTQLRIFVEKADLRVETDETSENNGKEVEVTSEVPSDIFDVEIPSVYQSGIKLVHPFEIIEGKITELTIDFDARESIIKTGNGNYILKPTIKLTTVYYDENEENTVE